MIFVTVGTVLPFDRLVRAVDQAVGDGALSEPVFAQIGRGGYRPGNMDWAETVDREVFFERVRESRALICHAGIGSIISALKLAKPVLVMPRRAGLREHVNDHQVETAEKFGEMGHVLVAADETEIATRIKELEYFVPVPRAPHPEAVVERIREFLWGDSARSRGN